MFLIEQEDINKCFYNDDDIKSHVIFINSCELPHYKSFVYFCEFENMMVFIIVFRKSTIKNNF